MSLPDKITAAELREITGLTDRRHRQMCDQFDYLPAPVDGLYEFLPWVRGFIKYHDERAERKTSSIADEKQKKLCAERQLVEIALARAKGDVLDAGLVEKEWSETILLCRQKLLNIPSKVAPRLLYVKTQQEMEAEIQKEIDEALAELSQPKQKEQNGAIEH